MKKHLEYFRSWREAPKDILRCGVNSGHASSSLIYLPLYTIKS